MASPVLRVILTAVDDVTGNAKKAGKGIADFASSAITAVKGFVAVMAAGALGKFFASAVQEADQARLGMMRMGQAVTNAGSDFTKLRAPLEAAVKSVQKMSTATDDELRAALTNMITVSGDAKGSMANLGLAADLAAFKQISLEEASNLVGKAMAGNTKGLREYGISVKDGADAIELLRQKVGSYAQNEAQTFSGGVAQIKNQFGEFKEAVGEVILQNGALGNATGFVAGALGNLAAWVERNEESLGALVRGVQNFFLAIWDVVKSIYEGLQPALGPIVQGLFKVLLFALDQAGAGVRLLGGLFMGTAAVILDAIGAIVEGGGKLLKVFGIEVVENFGKTLRASADNLRAAAERQISLGVQASKKGFADLFSSKVEHSKKVEQEETAHQGRLTKAVGQGQKDRQDEENKIFLLQRKLQEETMQLLTRAQQTLLKATKENRAEWVKSKEELESYFTSLRDKVLPTHDAIKRSLEENKEVLAEINEEDRKRFETEEQIRQSTRAIADGTVETATQWGVVSDKTADALSSTVDMGIAISRFGIDKIGGVFGLLGGLTALITAWASSPAEKARIEMTRRNIEALQKNTDALSTTATGKTIAGTKTALAAAQAAAAGVTGLVPGAGGIGRVPDWKGKAEAAREAFLQSLIGQGISRKEALALLEDLGIGGLESSDARTFLEALGAAGTQLGRFEVGKTGGAFAEKLKAIRDKFEVFGITDPLAQLQELAGLGKLSPALAAALGTGDTRTEAGRKSVASSLQQLFTDLVGGKFKGREAELGNISAGDLTDFIKEMLRLLGEGSSMTDFLTGVGTANVNRARMLEALSGGEVGTAPPPVLVSGGEVDVSGGKPGSGSAVGGQVIVNIGTVGPIEVVSLGDPVADGKQFAAVLINQIDVEIEQRVQQRSFAFGKLFAT